MVLDEKFVNTKRTFDTKEEAWKFFIDCASAIAILNDHRTNRWVVIYEERK